MSGERQVTVLQARAPITTTLTVGQGPSGPPGAAGAVTIQASEALAAGDWVNVFDSGGARVRKADASSSAKSAMGFVLAACALGDSVTVYFTGTNTGVTGQTPGRVFLSTTPGLGAATPPTGSGNVVQALGFCAAATWVSFEPGEPITLS